MSPTEAIENDIADMFTDPFASPDTLSVHARAFVEARIAKDTAEAVLKEANDLVMRAEAALMQSMKQNGMKSMGIEIDGKAWKLVTTKTPYYSLPKDANDRPIMDQGLLDWLELSGGADLVKSTIHHATFSSFCKELIDNAVSQGHTGSVLHPSIKEAVRSGVQMRKG